MKYKGSDWLIENMRHRPAAQREISQLGCDVADLLGELFYGIYHIDSKALDRVDWNNNRHIIITIGNRSWSTIDDSNLTRLVLLAHHRALRVSISAATHGYIRLMFHQRQRGHDSMRCHPTIHEALDRFLETISLPEYRGEL